MGKKAIWMIILLISASFLSGCSGTVKRTELNKVIDLSGRWNDIDSKLVSEEMIKDCMDRPWLNDFENANNRPPVVIVGTVINRSHEHINSQLFTKDLEKSMINSRKIKVVASVPERRELREERDSQKEGFTQAESIKEHGYETGADFMLKGSINTVKDEVKGKYVILYQVNLELIDLTNNEKVWIGEKEIKKYVKKSRFSL